jgi:hypothetical protein
MKCDAKQDVFGYVSFDDVGAGADSDAELVVAYV